MLLKKQTNLKVLTRWLTGKRHQPPSRTTWAQSPEHGRRIAPTPTNCPLTSTYSWWHTCTYTKSTSERMNECRNILNRKMPKRPMKNVWLLMRETQVKTVGKYSPTPITVTATKKTKSNVCCWGSGEGRISVQCYGNVN